MILVLEDQEIESAVDARIHSKSVEVTPIKNKFTKSRVSLYEEPKTVILSYTIADIFSHEKN